MAIIQSSNHFHSDAEGAKKIIELNIQIFSRLPLQRHTKRRSRKRITTAKLSPDFDSMTMMLMLLVVRRRWCWCSLIIKLKLSTPFLPPLEHFRKSWNWLFDFSPLFSFVLCKIQKHKIFTLSRYDDVTCSGQWLKIRNTAESLEPVSWHTIGRSSTSHSIFWPAKKRILLWSKSSVLRCHFILLSEWWVSCRQVAFHHLSQNLPPPPKYAPPQRSQQASYFINIL